jgi:histidyl-tRNA synthetase
MRKADRSGADFVLIIGENELKNEKLILRNMQTSQQEEIPLKNIVKSIKSRIKF